jgi:hypothetical protein
MDGWMDEMDGWWMVDEWMDGHGKVYADKVLAILVSYCSNLQVFRNGLLSAGAVASAQDPRYIVPSRTIHTIQHWFVWSLAWLLIDLFGIIRDFQAQEPATPSL